jgi:hypothetical protein
LSLPSILMSSIEISQRKDDNKEVGGTKDEPD